MKCIWSVRQWMFWSSQQLICKTTAENWKHWMMLQRFLILWNVISTGSHQSLRMDWRSQSTNWTRKIYWNTMNQSGMKYFKKVRHRVSEFKISRYVYPWRIIFKFKNEVFNRVVCRQVSRSESCLQWKIWVLRSDTNIWLIEDWLRWIMSSVYLQEMISPATLSTTTGLSKNWIFGFEYLLVIHSTRSSSNQFLAFSIVSKQ